MNDPKEGVAKVTCPTFEAMGQIPMFHRKYFLLSHSTSPSKSIVTATTVIISIDLVELNVDCACPRADCIANDAENVMELQGLHQIEYSTI